MDRGKKKVLIKKMQEAADILWYLGLTKSGVFKMDETIGQARPEKKKEQVKGWTKV